jgi:hypothetical protein
MSNFFLYPPKYNLYPKPRQIGIKRVFRLKYLKSTKGAQDAKENFITGAMCFNIVVFRFKYRL